jgi:sulfur-oxidizing protein SoxX
MLKRGTLAAVVALTAFGAGAGEIAPDAVTIVDGRIETPLTDVAGDPAEGRKHFAGRSLGNCLACHVNADQPNELFQGDVGPGIDGVASRYDAAELRAIVVNSKAIFGEQTIMPGFYTLEVGKAPAEQFVGKTVLTAQQVEDVIAYLLTLKD